MTTFAQGSRSQLLVKKQTTFEAVASGNFTKLRYNSHSLALNKSAIESSEIRSDRMVADFRHGQMSASGDITVDLCYADHNTLIESAMFNTFGTDTCVIGTTPQFLSIEDGQLDISAYRMFQSMVVNQMTVNFRPNQIVTASFGLVGKTMATPTTSTGGGTAVAASNNNPFDSFNGALYNNAEESGGEMLIVSSVSFTLANGVQPTFVIGQQTPQQLEMGRARITGTMQLYYNDSVWVNNHLNETECVLVINITDPDSNPMEFRFPRIKINTADNPVQGEGSRMISANFAALYDPTALTSFKITRT